MKTLVLGATGFVGTHLVPVLKAAGHEVHGLARSASSAAELTAAGVTPLEGDVRALDGWIGALDGFDAVITLLSGITYAEERQVMRTLAERMRGDGRVLIYTSGTAVLSIEAKEGQWDENSFAEDDPFPFPALEIRQGRLPIEDMVRDASRGGFRAMVVRPPLIYGHGGSNQVPGFFNSGLEIGRVTYVGHGLNIFSNVHVDDLAEVYPLALGRGKAGALYHAVGGEANFREIAEAVGQVLGLPVEGMSLEALCKVRHPDRVRLGLAVNSRSRAPRSRAELGWTPKRLDLIDDIRNGSYRAAFAGRTRKV